MEFHAGEQDDKALTKAECILRQGLRATKLVESNVEYRKKNGQSTYDIYFKDKNLAVIIDNSVSINEPELGTQYSVNVSDDIVILTFKSYIIVNKTKFVIETIKSYHN